MLASFLLGCFLSPIVAAGSSIDDTEKRQVTAPQFHSRSRSLQTDTFCEDLVEELEESTPAFTCICNGRFGGGYTSRCSLEQKCGTFEEIALSAFGNSCEGTFCLDFALETDYRRDGTTIKNEVIYDISGDTDYQTVRFRTEFPVDSGPTYTAFVTLDDKKYQCQSIEKCSSTQLDLFDCSNIQTEAVLQNGCPGGGFFFQQFTLCPQGGAMIPTTDAIVDVNPICFSGDAKVEVDGKGPVKMKDLRLGDSVEVDNGNHEVVYSFGHRNEVMSASFLHIATDNAKTGPLTISKDHMVFVGDAREAVPASMLNVGDVLRTQGGEPSATVQSIRRVIQKGAFAPFTASGKIVVEGVVASNYVAYQDSSHLKICGVTTPLSYQWIGHTFKSAHRLAFKMGIGDETYTEDGISRWVDSPHKFGQWLLDQNAFVIAIILIPTICIYSLIALVEALASLELVTALVGVAIALGLSWSRKGYRHKR